MEISAKLFFMDNLWKSERHIKEEEYVVNSIKNCNPEGEFAKKIGNLKMAPSEVIIQNLLKFKEGGYDMLIGYKEEDIMGNITFQKHIDYISASWKVFDYTIKKDYRNRGYCHDLTEKLMEIAKNKNVSRIKIGKPGISEENKFVKKLIGKLVERKSPEIKVDLQTNWIFIR